MEYLGVNKLIRRWNGCNTPDFDPILGFNKCVFVSVLVVGLARELITPGNCFKSWDLTRITLDRIRRYLGSELGSRFPGVPGRNKSDGVDIIEAHVEFARKGKGE